MSKVNYKFGEALTQAVYAIKARNPNKSLRVICDELGEKVKGSNGSCIDYWRKGHVPSEITHLETLALELKQLGAFDEKGFQLFLKVAGYNGAEKLLNEDHLNVKVSPEQVISHFGPNDDNKVSSEDIPHDYVPNVSTLPKTSHMPFAPNPHFIGRRNDLLRLAQALGDCAASLAPKTVTVTGFAGIGKTQLVIEFVHRYGCYFPGGVFWLNFAEPEIIPNQVMDCGGTKGLNIPNFDKLSFPDRVATVKQHWRSSSRCLLIFDNCEDQYLIPKWRPISGRSSIIITSLRTIWDKSLDIRQITLGILPRELSVELLQSLAHRLTSDEADAIAHRLGDFPLALDVAGKFLDRYHLIPVKTFLTEIDNDKLLTHPSLSGEEGGESISPTNHIQNVGRTFSLSIEKLDSVDPVDSWARKILNRASYFTPNEPIPIDLLLKTVLEENADSEKLRQATDGVIRLKGLGLLAGDNGSVRFHQLLGVVVREKDVDPNSLPDVENAVIEEAVRLNKVGLPLEWGTIQTHLIHLADNVGTRIDSRAAMLCGNLGYLLNSQGIYQDALRYNKHALEIREQLFGEENELTAHSLKNLGKVYENYEDYENAFKCHQRSLIIRTKLFGKSHPAVAQSLKNVGLIHKLNGQYELSLEKLLESYRIRKDFFGENHLSTASSLNSLGRLHEVMGDYVAAKDLFEKALAIRMNQLGELHPATADTLLGLSMVMQQMGDFVNARSTLKKVLHIRQQTLGESHPDTIIAEKAFAKSFVR